MDKNTRNAIERATQQARKLLEEDFASQLEGTFDVLALGYCCGECRPTPLPAASFSTRHNRRRD